MLKTVEWIERFIVGVLIVLLLFSIVMGTLELGSIVVTEVIDPPYLRIEVSRLYEIFGLFLVVLVGIELLRSVKSYLSHGQLKPDIVIEAAIIAIGNKLITLDIRQITPGILAGLAAVLVGLAAIYFVLRKLASS